MSGYSGISGESQDECSTATTKTGKQSTAFPNLDLTSYLLVLKEHQRIEKESNLTGSTGWKRRKGRAFIMLWFSADSQFMGKMKVG